VGWALPRKNHFASKMISFGAFDEQALGHEQALDTDFMVQ